MRYFTAKRYGDRGRRKPKGGVKVLKLYKIWGKSGDFVQVYNIKLYFCREKFNV